MKDTNPKIITILTLSAMILASIVISETPAQNVSSRPAGDSIKVWFHQSKSILDPELNYNGSHLERAIKRVKESLSSDSALRFASIRVIGSASPEGSVDINRRLSHNRADAIFQYFADRISLPDSITEHEFLGRDWNGLRDLVATDPMVPSRSEVLETLDNIIATDQRTGKDTDDNLKKIKSVGGGKPYQYLYRYLFPKLRYSRLYITYSYLYPERLLPKMSPSAIPLIARPEGTIDLDYILAGEEKSCHPFYMGVKTNLLYDVLALPSIGVEFYVGKNWSVVGNWTYGWWDRDRTHRYWRAYGGDIAIRKWFGKAADIKPLTGHHIGVYAGVVTYDFEFGGKGYMGGLPDKTLWDRCNYMAGIEYGYSLPIARRLNLDFTIGIGYLGGKLIEYRPKDEIYIWQKTKNFNWVGPTKAEVSLVWLIGCDNYNRKSIARKGGEL